YALNADCLPDRVLMCFKQLFYGCLPEHRHPRLGLYIGCCNKRAQRHGVVANAFELWRHALKFCRDLAPGIRDGPEAVERRGKGEYVGSAERVLQRGEVGVGNPLAAARADRAARDV